MSRTPQACDERLTLLAIAGDGADQITADNKGRAKRAGQVLQPAGHIDAVADYPVFQPPRIADISGNDGAIVQTNADTDRVQPGRLPVAVPGL